MNTGPNIGILKMVETGVAFVIQNVRFDYIFNRFLKIFNIKEWNVKDLQLFYFYFLDANVL